MPKGSPNGAPAAAPISDDRLGTVAVSLAVSELQWVPDIAPAVMDRISRDAVAYPEQFDRRRHRLSTRREATPPSEPSVARTVGRVAVIGVVIAVVVLLVILAATVSAADTVTASERILAVVTEVA